MSGRYDLLVHQVVMMYQRGVLLRPFTTATPCTTPVNIVTINIALTSATLGWDAVSGAWGYVVRYKQTSPVSSAWAYVTVNTNSYSLTGLTSGGGYRWQIYSICVMQITLIIHHFHLMLSLLLLRVNISLSQSTTNVVCNGGSTGAIDLSISGGSGSYSYLWSNGATTEDLTSLSAGSYSVTVTDTWGCVDSTTVVILDSPSISYTNSITICAGSSVIVGSNTYTTAGTYTDLLTAVNGCDSTVTTNLIVTPHPALPSLACYEDTATFDSTSCVWIITGTQPTQPTLACWETATFNTVTCAWDVTGSQPTQPTLSCYETATFNTETFYLAWDVTGTQPTQPNTCFV